MHLVKLTCPQCAAVVNADEAGETARCGYCGTVSRMQRRTGIFQRPMPLPQAPPDVSRLPVATEAYSRRFKLWLFAVPLAVGVVAVLISAATWKRQRYTWTSDGGVVLADVNRDGVLDPIGRAVDSFGDGSGRLVAFDGKTGRELWLSDVFSRDAPYLGWIAATADTVVAVKADAELVGYDVATGRRRFAVSLPEKPRTLCAGEPDRIAIVTADGKRVSFDAKTGALSPEPDAECWDPNRDGRVNLGPGHLALPYYESPGETPGMTVERAYRRRDGATVALGYRASGSKVPMVAARAGDGSFWTAELPQRDPLRAAEGSPEVATTAGDRLYVAYTPDAKSAGGWGWGSRLAAFTLADGRRLWDVPVEVPRGNALGVRAAGDRVYVSGTLILHIFAAADGKHLATAP